MLNSLFDKVMTRYADEMSSAAFKFQLHLKPKTDGTLEVAAPDRASIGITNPLTYASLRANLAINNTLVRVGLIDPKKVTFLPQP